MQNEKPDKVEEPEVAYNKKPITFFNSFKEMDESRYEYLASLSYSERLTNLEKLRKRVYHDRLLPDGNWPPLSRKLTIIKLDYGVWK